MHFSSCCTDSLGHEISDANFLPLPYSEIFSVLSANVMHNPKDQSVLQQPTVGAVHPREAVRAFRAEVAQNGQTIPCSGWCRLSWHQDSAQGPRYTACSCAKDFISLSRWFSFFWAPITGQPDVFLCQWGRTRAGYTHTYASEPESSCLAEPLLARRDG